MLSSQSFRLYYSVLGSKQVAGFQKFLFLYLCSLVQLSVLLPYRPNVTEAVKKSSAVLAMVRVMLWVLWLAAAFTAGYAVHWALQMHSLMV